MALSEEQRSKLAALAAERGDDLDEVLAEVESALEAEAPKPGKNNASSGGGEDAPAAAESGAKAHGGRGYFAYEFPFLRTNEVRASLFLEPVADGDLFTGEWLAKHAGGSKSPSDE